MQPLNRESAKANRYPTKIVQFGEGNFLRAFVDWIIWNTNKATDFNAGVVVVQPIERGMIDILNEQQVLYHANLQGVDGGETVDSIEMIDVINEAIAMVQPPSDKGKRLKIYYATQASIKPPTFVIFVNDKELAHFSYVRYLENQIRDAFELEGTPVRFIIRERGEKNN